MFANLISDKEQGVEYIKNSENSTVKTNNPIRTWTKDRRHFTEEDIEMAHLFIKKCLASLTKGKCKLRSQWDTTAHLLK